MLIDYQIFLVMLPETVGAHGVSNRLAARAASCVRRSSAASASPRYTCPLTYPFANVFSAHTGSDARHGVAEIQTPRQCENHAFIGKINSCATCFYSAGNQISISNAYMTYMNMIMHMAQEEISHDGCCNATHGGDINSDILITTQQTMCVQ